MLQTSYFQIVISIILLHSNSIEAFRKKKINCENSITTTSGTRIPKKPYCSGQLIFQDNFDTLNFENWQHEITVGGGGNGEFQWYTNNRSNSFVKNGALHIRPSLTSEVYDEEFLTSGTVDLTKGPPGNQCNNPNFNGCSRVGTKTNIINPIRSARIRTLESFSFKYGKLEVKAKMPAGDWLWPAIWLLPTENVYGGWPTSGEIDLLESRGNRMLITDNGADIGVKSYGTTLHYGPDPAHNGWSKAHFTTKNSNRHGFNKDFHVYSLIWTPENFKFYLDGVEVGEFNADDGFFKRGEFPENLNNPWKDATKMAPFDQEFHIILNLAIGGTNGYFPDNAKNPKPKPWLNASPQPAADFWNGRADWLPTWKYDNKNNEDRDLQIDYVRVYAL